MMDKLCALFSPLPWMKEIVVIEFDLILKQIGTRGLDIVETEEKDEEEVEDESSPFKE